MRHGLDTSFLVAAELKEHAAHVTAKAKLAELTDAGDTFVLAPQVVSEFLHVVTDARRLELPLEMEEARRVAVHWWTAREVEQAFPTDEAVRQFLDWLEQHGLGRKRLLDTLLAATYRQAGVHSLLTLNARDFGVLGGFSCVTP